MRRLSIFICSLLLILVTVKIIIENKRFQKSLPIKCEVVDGDEQELAHLGIIVLDNNNSLIEVIMHKENELSNIYEETFQLLTSQSNRLPRGINTPVNVSTKLIDYYFTEEAINLVVSEDFLRADINKSMQAISWTYKLLGFEFVNVFTSNGQEFSTSFNEYAKSNLVIETDKLNANIVTIFHPIELGYSVCTYAHNTATNIDYIIEKSLEVANITITNINYNISSLDNIIYINFETIDFLLDEAYFIAAIKKSILFLGVYQEVIIINNNNVYS